MYQMHSSPTGYYRHTRVPLTTIERNTMQQVSASRIVMYTLTELDKQDASFSPLSDTDVEDAMPAMVVKVDDSGPSQAVTIRVLSDSNGNPPRLTKIPFSDEKEPGTWHWPPRV